MLDGTTTASGEKDEATNRRRVPGTLKQNVRSMGQNGFARAAKMLMPEDAVYLQAIEDRRREFCVRIAEAEQRDPCAAPHLQAQLDELEVDYGSLIAAAVLI